MKSKANVEHELTFHIVETNQPGLLALTSSQDLGLIKVVMVTKTEEKQTELSAVRLQPSMDKKWKKMTTTLYDSFIPNLTTVTESIRVILRKDIEFQWSHEQDKALQEIKSILTKDGGPVLGSPLRSAVMPPQPA